MKDNSHDIKHRQIMRRQPLWRGVNVWLSKKIRSLERWPRRKCQRADLVAFAHQMVIASMTDAVIVLDAQGRVIELNPAACLLLDQTTAQVLGCSLEKIFQRANLLEDWMSLAGRPTEIVTGNGMHRQTYELRTHSLSDNADQTAGRLVVLHDITEQRALAEQVEERDRELKALAAVDDLTGLATPRRLFELGERELTRAHRFGHPLSVVLFDLDHFKRINDRHGRAIGDQVLGAVALLVQNNIRDTDLFARYGGEEFVIALPETDLSSACEVAERIRKTVAEMQVQTEKEAIRMTISLGVAEITAETRQFADVLTAADNAMRKAKQAGRNRIFFADHSLARHFYFDFLPA